MRLRTERDQRAIDELVESVKGMAVAAKALYGTRTDGVSRGALIGVEVTVKHVLAAIEELLPR